MPNFNAAKDYALQRLQTELPKIFYYHSLKHTRDDVVPAVQRFADLANLNDEERLLLLTAAWFHDIGFTQRRDAHETLGVEIARQVLPTFAYHQDQIETIAGIIMATRLPQTPHNFLEELIADADLDSLGREDFFETSHNLLEELHACGSEINWLDWYRGQHRFLSEHSYWTQVAHDLRHTGKRANIAELERRIAHMEAD